MNRLRTNQINRSLKGVAPKGPSRRIFGRRTLCRLVFSKGAGLELTFIANFVEQESLDSSIGEPACRKQGRCSSVPDDLSTNRGLRGCLCLRCGAARFGSNFQSVLVHIERCFGQAFDKLAYRLTDPSGRLDASTLTVDSTVPSFRSG
jgi:hypothetical protein